MARSRPSSRRPGRAVVNRWNTLALPLGGLWLLAILVALAGLGQLPLRDWDESLVARVALEASEKPWPDLLLPTYWGNPYLNKPPGLHLLIGGAIQLWRASTGSGPATLPPEWLLRLVPALLSSTVVPLVGLVQARLRPAQTAVAVASSAMALTLLPLARHGRLVMLDGCQLAAILLIWGAVLTPDHRRGSLLLHGGLMGAGASALLLLKAPLAFPLLLATMLLRALDRELRPVQWLWLLGGLALGLLPGLAWHGAHAYLRGSDALDMWLGQGFARVHEVIEGNTGGIWMPITEVLEGGWPWLALWPGAMALAWRERRTRAGRWCLGTTAISALLVLPLRTQLPWYSQLFWPPLRALLRSCVGVVGQSPDQPAPPLGRPPPARASVLGPPRGPPRGAPLRPRSGRQGLPASRWPGPGSRRRNGGGGPAGGGDPVAGPVAPAPADGGDPLGLRPLGCSFALDAEPPLAVGTQRTLAGATRGRGGAPAPRSIHPSLGPGRAPKPQLVCRQAGAAHQGRRATETKGAHPPDFRASRAAQGRQGDLHNGASRP